MAAATALSLDTLSVVMVETRPPAAVPPARLVPMAGAPMVPTSRRSRRGCCTPAMAVTGMDHVQGPLWVQPATL